MTSNKRLLRLMSSMRCRTAIITRRKHRSRINRWSMRAKWIKQKENRRSRCNQMLKTRLMTKISKKMSKCNKI
jgi:hypothetical protein